MNKHLRTLCVYGLFLLGGLALGFAVPRAYAWLKPAYVQGDYSAYLKGQIPRSSCIAPAGVHIARKRKSTSPQTKSRTRKWTSKSPLSPNSNTSSSVAAPFRRS